MKTPFSVVLKRFADLSALAEAESDEIHKLIGKDSPGIEFGANEMWDLISEPFPTKRALEAFLEALPSEVVYAICALMYAGRDGDYDFASFPAHIRKTFIDRADAIRAISEKSPRMRYIDAGVAIATKALPLDELPARIAATAA